MEKSIKISHKAFKIKDAKLMMIEKPLSQNIIIKSHSKSKEEKTPWQELKEGEVFTSKMRETSQ